MLIVYGGHEDGKDKFTCPEVMEIRLLRMKNMREKAMKCNKCGREQETRFLKSRKYICRDCGSYMRIPARERISLCTDKNSFREWFEDVKTGNPIQTKGYEDKIKNAKEKTGLSEAVVVGKASVFGKDICIGVCDAGFLMASMGYVVGERITLAIERATKEKIPVFMFCCSGGARMQEGIISLMQMEKTAAAIANHSNAGQFYCSVLTDPTTGGVTASFAMLGDVIMAEPGALVGFAGQRVIKQTIGKDLPEGFQTAEFQEVHGMIDGIVERKRLKQMMLFLIMTNGNNNGYTNFREITKNDLFNLSKAQLKKMTSVKKTPWERVQHVRSTKHPAVSEYVDKIFDIFVEFKGDRYFGNDEATVGGIALIDGQPITVIMVDRGRNLKDYVKKNWGMPNPEGYRKALRLMKQADKFNRPIITFINTMGAYPGMEAEERGQGEAIARNLLEMSNLEVPVLAIIAGEAGSGGALAVAVGNEVWMFENATYSILTPEGYASILWKDSSRAEEAAGMMHITANDLERMGIIERIIPEFGGATSENVDDIAGYLKVKILDFLKTFDGKSRKQIREERYQRFRHM